MIFSFLINDNDSFDINHFGNYNTTVNNPRDNNEAYQNNTFDDISNNHNNPMPTPNEGYTQLCIMINCEKLINLAHAVKSVLSIPYTKITETIHVCDIHNMIINQIDKLSVTLKH